MVLYGIVLFHIPELESFFCWEEKRVYHCDFDFIFIADLKEEPHMDQSEVSEVKIWQGNQMWNLSYKP